MNIYCISCTIQAEEISESHRFTTAKLTIEVKPVDANPPVISITSNEGFVDENSPVGTKVVDTEGNRVRLTVTDADLVSAVENQPVGTKVMNDEGNQLGGIAIFYVGCKL